MMAYAQVYGCRDLMLVYPHHAGLPAPAGRLADFGIVDRDGARLTLLSLDLTALSTVRDQLRTALMRTDCPAAAE